MQVAVGAGQPDLLVDQAAQRRRDRRRLRVPHAGVADQRQVALELGGIVAHEAEQVFRAALLLALDHHGDVERQLAGHRLEGAAGLDEGHGLAFVVAGAARDDDLAAAVERLDARLERRRLPQIERIDRLHVVMAVEQHARRLAVAHAPLPRFADHHRMALRSAARWSRSRGCAVGGDMLGGGAAVRRVGRIGRDRLDAQQREQPLEAGVEIAVDAVENRGQSFRCRHAVTVSTRRRARRARRPCRSCPQSCCRSCLVNSAATWVATPGGHGAGDIAGDLLRGRQHLAARPADAEDVARTIGRSDGRSRTGAAAAGRLARRDRAHLPARRQRTAGRRARFCKIS